MTTAGHLPEAATSQQLKRAATTSTADTPRRSPPPANGYARPLICSANWTRAPD